MKRLESKVILMAGAGWIGNECARRYASEGAAVVLGDIREEIAQAAVEEIKSAGGRAIATRMDGADETSVNAAVALACKTYGGLDGLHANFMVAPDGKVDILQMPMEMYDKSMHVNVRGYLLCARAALPEILKRGGGSIIFTSSGAGNGGARTRAAYAMSKSAGHALMRHIATRFGENGVRANCIAPGVIDRPDFTDEIRQIGWKRGMVPRLGKPLDIAAMCALLMADEGSYITGQVLAIDGGVSMYP